MAKLILAKVLKKQGWSKRKFAAALGVAYKNVFRLFHDSADPRLSALTKYAKVLGVRVSDLFSESKKRK